MPLHDIDVPDGDACFVVGDAFASFDVLLPDQLIIVPVRNGTIERVPLDAIILRPAMENRTIVAPARVD